MPSSLVIDSLRFSERSDRRSGCLALGDLPRLVPELENSDGSLEFILQGGLGQRGERLLELKVEGVLWLSCQRCLQPVAFDVNVDTTFELRDELSDVPTQEELEDDTRDLLLASRSMDVVSLIEDEVLLALPAAPCHEETCVLPEVHHDPETASSFGALLKLKGHLGRVH